MTISGTSQEHLRDIPAMSHKHHSNIPGTFQENPSNVAGTTQKHLRNIFKQIPGIPGPRKQPNTFIPGTSQEQPRNIPGTSQEHSRNIGETFQEGPEYMPRHLRNTTPSSTSVNKNTYISSNTCPFSDWQATKSNVILISPGIYFTPLYSMSRHGNVHQNTQCLLHMHIQAC